MSTQDVLVPVRQRPPAGWATPPADPGTGGDIAPYQLAEALGRLVRLISRLKSEFAARHPGSPADFGAMSLLLALVEGGPRRAGALAESVLMDPSQVSRRVALLVRAGLVERRADSADGRAIVLAATPAGRELCSTMMCARAAYLRSVVEDWPEQDLAAFVSHLDRFAATLERAVAETAGRFGPVSGFGDRLPDPSSRPERATR